MASLLVRNATVILPAGRAETNILIEDGRIISVDAPHQTSVDAIIDCPGQVLLPGLIDDQVHFREPGLTHKEDLSTATAACAAGGVTSFLEMPNTNPSATTRDLVFDKYELARTKSLVNYGFYIGATTSNIEELKLAENIPGIKIFIGSSTGDLLVDNQDALERIFAETALPICAHCEDETTVRKNLANLGPSLTISDHSKVRDVQAAVIATCRALDLAKRHQHRFHVLHVSTADEIPLLIDAKPFITAEVCPHHLFFNVDDYARLGSLIQMNPSIKNQRDNRELWEALVQGVVQVVATDHAPHTLKEKQELYPRSPSGLPAVENYLALLMDQAHQGRCTWEQIASWTSDAPARVWGLVGRGRIEVGYSADLVIVDPNRRRTIQNELQYTKSRWSPWHGITLCGWPTRTIVNGQTVFVDNGTQPRGTILPARSAQRLRCDHRRGGYWATDGGIGL